MRPQTKPKKPWKLLRMAARRATVGMPDRAYSHEKHILGPFRGVKYTTRLSLESTRGAYKQMKKNHARNLARA